MSERRVVVIGAGAAGAAAALAASASGARATLLRPSPGATALSSGALDLAGSRCERPADPWAGRPATLQSYEQLLHDEPDHPLARCNVGAAAAARIVGALAPVAGFSPRSLDLEPLVLPTDLGTFKSTALCQPGAQEAHLLGLAGRRVGVVGISGYPLFDPARLAAGYQHHAARGGIELICVPLTVELIQRRGDERMHPHELAREVEREAVRGRLGDQLRRAAARHELSLLMLPPLIGLEQSEQTLVQLRQQSGDVPLAEVLASPPSVPGLRLQRHLDAALESAGVAVLPGRASQHHGADARLSSVVLEDGTTVEGDAFVLATGKFIGRGLVHDPVLREGLFDLPVWIGGDGPDLSYLGKYMARQVGVAHPLFGAGLRTDAALRPRGRSGEVAWGNLHAAGSVLGGYDYIQGRSGLGTALISGHVAGAYAAGGQP
jgi:glycerol-3-phosphate dehydrogenase subunit B